MDIRKAFSGVLTAGFVLAFMPLGCGAAQEEYTVIERPATAVQDEPRRNELPLEVRQQVQECFGKHVGLWSQPKVSLHYEAKADPSGALVNVTLQKTTLRDDNMESCVRQAIASMTISEQELRSRRSGPVSGGERMSRERRGPMGSSDSQNPLVWGFVILMEAVEFEVVVQVFVGAVAAVGTIATSKKKDPKKECLDKYEACTDGPLGSLQVNVHGESVCATCLRMCNSQGAWPSGFEKTIGWQTCR